MTLLVLVSFVWAFSFGLIGNQLAGLPPAWLAWIRLGLSAAVFLPFVRRVPWKSALALFATGAVQFGLMYLAYMTSFRYLKSHEVALFTVVTPLFVAGLDDLFGRKFKPWNLLAALLAVAGAGLIKWQSMETAAPLYGILLVQASNLCFAAGQLAYRSVMARMAKPLPDHRVFFWLHFGGFAALTPIALPLALAATPPAPTPAQWAILVYLGIVASGLCFFLWNRGARLVNAGQLAVLNNLKIPLAVAVSLLIFRETAGLPTLLAGALLIAVALFPVRKS
ncbi:MAG TPA: EamA family transporter [Verrucomicrobia bacterium]|nr:EamA family transporter [Verrucomicrobiota bacterium]